MKRTCQYCDSPLLDTDDVCWHCGRSQPSPRPEQRTSATPITESEEESDQELEPGGRGRTLLYAALTLIVVIALLLVMRSLGRSPVMVYGVDAPEGEWVYVKAPDDVFSIEIPVAWQWQFTAAASTSSELPELLATDDRVIAAVRPLADLVPDIAYIMIAQADEHLLVIARSARLNRLTPQQTAAALPSEQFTGLSILQADVVSGSSGESRTRILLAHEDAPLRCNQHLVPGLTEAYLVAACTTEDSYRLQQEVFDHMLYSFSTPAR